MTVTDALAFALPPGPVQVTEYEVVLPGTTLSNPLVAPPVEKFVPVQEVAFVEDQVRVEELPWTTEVGSAVSVAVGRTAGTVIVKAGVYAFICHQ